MVANKNNLTINSIEEIFTDFSQGKMVILVDDENRENEGDLVIAASKITADHINFMALHGRGLICLTVTEERCRKLGLPLMVHDNNARHSTNFTVSIEAATGVTTGISAADRATTVAAAVKPDAVAADIVTPGHIFPIKAQPGGVLTRAGHTEAGVDLARICKLEPASVICEILNPDGSMARLPDLLQFGAKHGIKIGSIADLIRYRLRHESTVERVATYAITTPLGQFKAVMYYDSVANTTHLALTKGAIRADTPTYVRVHVHLGAHSSLLEAFGTNSWTTSAALQKISAEPAGALVLLDYPSTNDYTRQQLSKLANSPPATKTGTPTSEYDDSGELRMLGAGSQILTDLGVGKVVVLGTPRKTHALSGFSIDVVDYISRPD